MTEELEITILTANAALGIIRLAGTLNMDTSEDFFSFTEKMLNEHHCKKVIVEVRDVDYVSSAGIGVFMSLYERLENDAGEAIIILVGVSEAFRRVLDLVGCLDYFILMSSFAEAQQYILQEQD